MNGLARTSQYGMLPLSAAFDRLFQTAFTPVMGSNSETSSGVAANIWETGDTYQIALVAPGVNPAEVDITALRNTITVSGSMEVGQPEGVKSVWQEFGPQQFRRQISLPAEVDSEHVEATYRNGILLLSVPKSEHAKPRQIKVQTTYDQPTVKSSGEALPAGQS
jgi:HSP20 family protein